MCGISGYISNKNNPLGWDKIQKLWLSIENRGKDASGVAWSNGDYYINILKGNMSISEFIKSPEVLAHRESIENSKMVMLHTRAATHGSPTDNNNNHPIFNGRGVLIHNGIVKTKRQYKGKGICDSEQLMLAIQNEGWEKSIVGTSGMMAIAYFDTLNKSLYLYRDTSPMFYTDDKELIVYNSYFYPLKSNISDNVMEKKPYSILRIKEDTLEKKVIMTFITPKTQSFIPKHNKTYAPAYGAAHDWKQTYGYGMYDGCY